MICTGTMSDLHVAPARLESSPPLRSGDPHATGPPVELRLLECRRCGHRVWASAAAGLTRCTRTD